MDLAILPEGNRSESMNQKNWMESINFRRFHRLRKDATTSVESRLGEQKDIASNLALIIYPLVMTNISIEIGHL